LPKLNSLSPHDLGARAIIGDLRMVPPVQTSHLELPVSRQAEKL
jgi:hypothetical protein